MSAQHRAVMHCTAGFCGAWWDHDDAFESESCDNCGSLLTRRTEAELDAEIAPVLARLNRRPNPTKPMRTP